MRACGLLLLWMACDPSAGGRPDRVGKAGTDETGGTFPDPPTTDTYPEARDTGSGEPPTSTCHPYDPVRIDAWTRTYEVTTSDGEAVSPPGSLVEVHTGLGTQPVPDLVRPIAEALALPTEAQAYETTTLKDGTSTGVVVRVWRACGAAPDAPDSPYVVTSQLQAVGSARKVNLIAGAPYAYLGPADAATSPELGAWGGRRAELANWWSAFCGRDARADRAVDAVGFDEGFEDLTIPALGTVRAWHVVELSQSQVSDVATTCLFPELFGSIFDEAFGATNTSVPDVRRRVRADRWYVADVGLVKEVVTELQAGPTDVRAMELTACTGLPGCP